MPSQGRSVCPAGRQQPQAVGGGLERGGLGPPRRRRRHRLASGEILVGADVDRAVDNPDESGTALIGGQGFAGGGIDGQGVAALVDGGAAGQEGDGLGRAAVIGQRAEARVGDADLVAVVAVDQAAGTTGADQVVRAGGGYGAGDDVIWRGTANRTLRLFCATIVLYNVAVPPCYGPAPPAVVTAMVELVIVNSSRIDLAAATRVIGDGRVCDRHRAMARRCRRR